MPKTLIDYEKIIFTSNYTEEEWLKIDKDVTLLFETSTQQEIAEFVQSGAGDMLDMVLEYM